MTTIWRPDMIRVLVYVQGDPEWMKITFKGSDAAEEALKYAAEKGRVLTDIFVLTSSGAGHHPRRQYMEVPATTNLERLAESLPRSSWGEHAHVQREISVAAGWVVPKGSPESKTVPALRDGNIASVTNMADRRRS